MKVEVNKIGKNYYQLKVGKIVWEAGVELEEEAEIIALTEAHKIARDKGKDKIALDLPNQHMVELAKRGKRGDNRLQAITECFRHVQKQFTRKEYLTRDKKGV